MTFSEAPPAAPDSAATQQLAWRRARRWTIAICAALLLTFAALAWTATLNKSPTVDEPYHALAGWLHLWRGEFRFDSEDPPLWNELAALAAPPRTLSINESRIDWSKVPLITQAEYRWAIGTLFWTPGNSLVGFLGRMRLVMLGVALILGVTLGMLVWRMSRATGVTASASAAATVFAIALFAFDPNFLAHAALVKNDVAAAFALLVLSACAWSAGRVLSLRRILLLGIWTGVAVGTKFTGPLLAASAAVLLTLRALSPWPWRIILWPGRESLCGSRISRAGAAIGALTVMGIIALAMIWVSYGCRYAPSAAPGATLDNSKTAVVGRIEYFLGLHPERKNSEPPAKSEVLDLPVPLTIRTALFADRWHLLPEAFIAGVLFVFANSQTRATFLLGKSSFVGTWWYFPFAMAVKTPVGTLAAIAFAASLFGSATFRSWRNSRVGRAPTLEIQQWTAMCLCVPIAIYLAAAMSSNLNLGIRHVLPIYPLLFAAVGLAMAKAWNQRRQLALAGGVAIVLALALETCCAFPNYIPFFNVIVGGNRGGVRLLSDSNLDWGQDLPLLAQWQRQHPNERLYFAYFGTDDPAYYGIRYTNLLDGYIFGPPAQPISSPGVLAISATTLQGTYSRYTFDRPTWYTLWTLKPFDVLGGSIYLFHVPPSRADYLPMGQSLIN